MSMILQSFYVYNNSALNKFKQQLKIMTIKIYSQLIFVSLEYCCVKNLILFLKLKSTNNKRIK